MEYSIVFAFYDTFLNFCWYFGIFPKMFWNIDLRLQNEDFRDTFLARNYIYIYTLFYCPVTGSILVQRIKTN